MKSLLIVLVIMGAMLGKHTFASQHSTSDQLMKRIQALEERIAVLESRFSFAFFMPDFAERFHVMHRAGESGDWAVASHELQTMKQIMQLSTSIDADKGKLMMAMLEPNFEALEHAIEDGSHGKFEKALIQTIDTCNACHTATDSSFVQVTLDTSDSLSMRHPHRFMEQQAPIGHTHGTSAGMMGGMMTAEPASDDHHDEASSSEHQHDADTPAHKD